MGLKPEEFYNMWPRDFILMQRAYEDNLLGEEQRVWNSTRWIASVLIQPHLRKGKKIKPKDLAKFPWDEKETKTIKENKEHILKQAKYAAKLYDKIWSNHGKEKD